LLSWIEKNKNCFCGYFLRRAGSIKSVKLQYKILQTVILTKSFFAWETHFYCKLVTIYNICLTSRFCKSFIESVRGLLEVGKLLLLRGGGGSVKWSFHSSPPNIGENYPFSANFDNSPPFNFSQWCRFVDEPIAENFWEKDLTKKIVTNLFLSWSTRKDLNSLHTCM
jgi:hypothetical protein